MTSLHPSVLLEEAVEHLSVQEGDTVVDATVGGAGHFASLYARLGSTGTLIGIDADQDALTRAQKLVSPAGPRVLLIEDNFRNLSRVLDAHQIHEVDAVLFDLGWSGYQLVRGRGFSFRADEPLLMTYGDPEKASVTAADLVNTLPEEALSDLLFTLGEERFARQIARGIADARKRSRLLTTFELVRVIEASVPAWYRTKRLHPATKTFQALRIAVNDELGALREGLTAALSCLSEEGRVAVITFHSIEDRMVKTMFRDKAHEGEGCLVTKKPITPSLTETKENPRARSAKLRVFMKGPCTPSRRVMSSSFSYAS